MKEMVKSKRIWVALLSIAAILICSFGLATLALETAETDDLTNTFFVGNVTTEIEEEFEKTEVATEFKKVPTVKNTGENACLVRVRVTASPEEQLTISGWNTTDWTEKQEDGFYYYTQVLQPGDSTSALFTKVAVKDAYKDTIEDFEVTVYQEAVQAELHDGNGNVLKSVDDNGNVVWGNIDKIWDIYDQQQTYGDYE